MTNIFVPANLQWVGVAREATYGTAVATPTLYVPADTPQYHEVRPPLKDQALRGMMGTTYGQQQSMMHDEFSFKTYGYLDSVYFFIRAALGLPDAITGSADPYTHKTALVNASNAGQPFSSTVFWNDGNGKAWQMPGSQIAEVKVTAKIESFYQLDIKYVGLPATVISSPTNSPTSAMAWPSWNSSFTLGASLLTTYSEIDIDIKRATEMIPTITGSQTPFAIFAGALTVTGTVNAVYQGSTDVNWVDYINNTQPSFSLKAAPAGDATHSLTLQMSKIAYEDMQVSGSNKWMEIKGPFEAIMNTTDALDGNMSPIQGVLVSPVSTAI